MKNLMLNFLTLNMPWHTESKSDLLEIVYYIFKFFWAPNNFYRHFKKNTQ